MNDNLWLIHGTNLVKKFPINSNGTFANSNLSITGLSEPTAVAVSPNNFLVVIIDAGNSQQVKAFSNTTGASIWTLGQSGGYSTDPSVTNTKFYFRDTTTRIQTNNFIAFQQDSSFWVGDPGNDRLMHFASNRTYIDQIMSMPCTYSIAVDPNNPTRVFNNFLEFKIDYSKNLSAKNGSWTLIRNWRKGVPASFFNTWGVFQNVITLSNNRTYATLEDDNVKKREIIELPPTGNIRFTGIKLNSDDDFIIDNNGNLMIMYTGGLKDTMQWTNQNLTGFDSKNNPIWSAPKTIASSPATTIKDPKPNMESLPAKTGSDKLIVFCPRKVDGYGLRSGFHLGAIKKGTNKWLWKTSKSTEDSYEGPMPNDGSFDIGNGVEYPGGHAYAIENNIFWNYHGEFWKNSQTNIWNHYADNGLMLGQFGVTTPDGEAINREAFSMGAGNVFSSAFVKKDSFYYLYHNDESVHGAVHRWKISGLNTIVEQKINLKVVNKSGGLTAAYFDGNSLNNINFATAKIDTTVNLTNPPSQIANSNNFSTRWSGFIKPTTNQAYKFYTNTTKGLRLWIDGNLILNDWNNNVTKTNTSNFITLEANKMYSIKMEINGGTAALYWSTSSISKQIIPSHCLIPEDFPNYSPKINLLEGLNHKTNLQNNLYGWTRNPVNDVNIAWDNYWNANTGVRSFNQNETDLLIKFRKDASNYAVYRDLDLKSKCIKSWKLNGIMNLDQNYPEITNEVGGMQIELLDNQGKIIFSITHEMVWQGTPPPSYLKINGTTVFTKPENQFNAIINKNQAFSAELINNKIKFTYGNFAPISVSALDNAAKLYKPATLRVNFISRADQNYDQYVSFSELSFEPIFSTAQITAPKTKICQGETLTLTANTGRSYLWSNSASSKSITVNTAGSYFVTVTDSNYCQIKSETITTFANPIPTAVITPNGPLKICQGSSVALTSNSAKSYKWSNNANTQTISVSSGGTYSLTITDSNGCISSSTQKTVVVNPNPIIKLVANGPLTFCQGKSVGISTKFTGSYLWSNSSSNQSITASNSGKYFLKGTDINGCSANSDSLSVNVITLPQQKIKSSGKTTFCNGSFVDLSSSFIGTYQWNNTAKTSQIRANQTGSYSFTGIDSNGCQVKSDSVKVTVNPSPSETIINSGPLTFCEGDSVGLTAASGLSYLWNTGDTTQTIKVKTSGKYFAELSNQYKCNGLSKSIDVLVNRTPKPSIIVNNVILTSTEANGNQWYLNGAPIQNATAQTYRAVSLGTYYVGSSNGTCIGNSQSVTITSLSAKNLTMSNLFKLFPNPTNGILNFENSLNKHYSLKIFNVYGQIIYSIESQENLNINLMNFAAGNYKVKVEIENYLFTQNIIKI
jgi:hypothetical protein